MGKTMNISSEMIYRDLGTTGAKVSALGLGGSHIGESSLSSAEAVRIIRRALDAGLNFMDNSWDYHGGESEHRLGEALQDGYRAKAFVMTKVDGRNKKEAARQIDESLRRLRVDTIDLLQHHEIIRFDDADRIFAEGGAMEAFIEAREAGKIRFIGFTGHKDPEIHLYMLETARRHDFRFDAVQMPLNVFDVHFRSFERKVLPRLVAEKIAVLGMKSLAGGVLVKNGALSVQECLHYALNLPASVVISGIDSMEVLEQNLAALRSFKPLSDEELASLRAKSLSDAKTGAFELFKTTTVFDSTVAHPKFLGEESPRTKELAGR